MPGFKDILKKAAEAAQKGLAKIQEAAEFERLMSDFDEVVASVATDILTEKGYRPIGQREVERRYLVELAIENGDLVKPVIDRDMLRKYSPKDRQKILNVIPDRVLLYVTFTRKHQPAATLLRVPEGEDVTVYAELTYFVEKKGFFGPKREEKKIRLGQFSFRSSDFVDYEAKTINTEALKAYLEKKLKGLGLF